MKSNFKVGDVVFVLALMKFFTVVSVRDSGSLRTLWIEDSSGEALRASALIGSNNYVLKMYQSTESYIVSVNKLVSIVGIISIILIFVHYLDIYMK